LEIQEEPSEKVHLLWQEQLSVDPCGSNFCEMNLNSTTYTPPKINMETKNSPFEKEHHLPSLHVVGLMLIFQGVDGLSPFPKVVTA